MKLIEMAIKKRKFNQQHTENVIQQFYKKGVINVSTPCIEHRRKERQQRHIIIIIIVKKIKILKVIVKCHIALLWSYAYARNGIQHVGKTYVVVTCQQSPQQGGELEIDYNLYIYIYIYICYVAGQCTGPNAWQGYKRFSG